MDLTIASFDAISEVNMVSFKLRDFAIAQLTCEVIGDDNMCEHIHHLKADIVFVPIAFSHALYPSDDQTCS